MKKEDLICSTVIWGNLVIFCNELLNKKYRETSITKGEVVYEKNSTLFSCLDSGIYQPGM